MRRALLPLLGLVVAGAPSCDSCGQDPLITLIPLGAVQPTADFGQRYLGVTAELPVTIGSQGTAPLAITALTLEGDGFAMAGDPRGDVAVGQSVGVTVTFRPTVLGPAAGVLRIETNAINGPTFVVTLTGEGIPDLECPPSAACRMFSFDRGAGACVEQDIAGPCNDGSLCTSEDHCDAGVCVGLAMQCPTLGDCGRGVCDPTLGCFNVGDPNLCDDDDPCTADNCSDAGACSNVDLPEGSPCGEFPACTVGACTAGSCTPSVLPDGTLCDDRRICTAGDVCAAGQCAGVRVVDEPSLGGVASTFNFGEAFVFPDPVSLPDDVWFFRGRNWYLSDYFPLLRDVRAVRVTGSTIATQAVEAPSTAIRVPYAVKRFAGGLVAVSADDSSSVVHVSTFGLPGGAAQLVPLGDVAFDELFGGAFTADGARAFLAGYGLSTYEAVLHAVDLSNPAAPVETDSVVRSQSSSLTALVATTDRLFLGSTAGLELFDTTGGMLVPFGGDAAGVVLDLALSDVGVLALRAVGSDIVFGVFGDHLDLLDPTTGAVVSTLDVAGRGVSSLAAHGARAALFGAELELISLPSGAVIDHRPYGFYSGGNANAMSSTLLLPGFGPGFSLAGDRVTPLTAPDLGQIGLPRRVASRRVVAVDLGSARALDVTDAAAPRFVAGGYFDDFDNHILASLVLLEDGRLTPGHLIGGGAGAAYGPVIIVDATDLDEPFVASARSPAAVLNERFVFMHGSTLIGLSARQPDFPCDIDCVGGGRVVLETFDLATQPPFPYARLGAAVLPDPDPNWLDSQSIAVDAAVGRIAAALSPSVGPTRIIVGDASDPTAPRLYQPVDPPGQQFPDALALYGDRLYLLGADSLVVFEIGESDISPIGELALELIPGADPTYYSSTRMALLAVDDEVLVVGLPTAVGFLDITTMPPMPLGAVEMPFAPQGAASDGDQLIVTGGADVTVLRPACPPP